MPWIQTRGGRHVDLLHPDPATIDIRDIAFALSHLVRYTGHAGLYTVAQHSVLCSRYASPELALEALMHDAHEAYLGDVSTPLKVALRAALWSVPSAFDALDRSMRRAVAKRFGLAERVPAEVKVIDMRMLQTERLQFLHPRMSWEPEVEQYEPYATWIGGWSSMRAESEFLRSFESLR